MKRFFPFLLVALFLVNISCRQDRLDHNKVQYLPNDGKEQYSPWLTTNNEGVPVLCWTEKQTPESPGKLVFSIYDADEELFGSPVIVSGSEGSKSSPEAMNKVAFKSDGSIIAVFAKPFEHEKNPYAGAIYYSMSSDRGASWTPAKYIHSDTSHVFGRGYFDVATLKNGQVGAVWLDGRYKNEVKGSAIFFAATQKNGGFSGDTCISKGTCECCRTDLLTGKNGTLHIAYRSIMYPPGLMGKQARDMVYCSSNDNGKSFSAQQAISHDNWAIDGCPHTGPSLAVNDKGIHAVWFTGGGSTGLYFTSASPASGKFDKRSLITSTGRHPQMVSLPDGRLAMVCEEAADTAAGTNGGSHEGMSHQMAAPGAKIVLRLLNKGNSASVVPITDGKFADHHPVALAMNDRLLVAWVRETNGHASVCYSGIRF